MKIKRIENAGFENPILGELAEIEYVNMFGEDGIGFVKILETSPKENAVISRLLMYLHKKCKEE